MPVDDEALLRVQARRLLKLTRDTDLAVALSAGTAFRTLPQDVQEAAAKELPRHGRRHDIREQHRKQLETDPTAKEPLVVKVTIAGSGFDTWATRANPKGARTDENLQRVDATVDEKLVAMYAQKKGEVYDYTISGPGGPGTKGKGSQGGTWDQGSNSIENIVNHVPGLVKAQIDERLEEEPGRPVVILIKSHSRGAVAASRVAEKLSGYRGAKLELVQVDPVPGPSHTGDDVEIDLNNFERGKGVEKAPPDESTLIYSVASGYWYTGSGFKPQKVHGAKRIIVSRQDHSVGLANGFVYQGRLYTGSSLNSLPDGVYVDLNVNNKHDVPLVKVESVEEAKEKIAEARKGGNYEDSGRNEVIDSIVGEKNLPPRPTV